MEPISNPTDLESRSHNIQVKYILQIRIIGVVFSRDIEMIYKTPSGFSALHFR